MPRGNPPHPNWTPEIIAMLGINTDSQIAAIVKLSISAVGQKRRSLGIAHPLIHRDFDKWQPFERKMLGKLDDKLIAGITGRSIKSVRQARFYARIPAKK